MLVLSRQTGQAIVIGDEITIRVLRVRGKVISLGIDAPRSVVIRRGELGQLAEPPAAPPETISPTVVSSPPRAAHVR